MENTDISPEIQGVESALGKETKQRPQSKEEGFWTEEKYAGKEYDLLKDYPPKTLLDKSIASFILEISDELGKIEVAELGAGRAPISKLLSNDPSIKCKAFDKNPDMAGTDQNLLPEYDKNFDLRSPQIREDEIGRYDVVVMENSLYTVTIPEKGTDRVYTDQEAELLRNIAIKKAASMLKPGGYLILSEPHKTSGSFSLKRIWEFLSRDKKARDTLSFNKKNVPSIAIDYLSNKEMTSLLKRNQQLMARTNLETAEGIKGSFSRTGLFEEPQYWDEKSYLGSNVTAIFQRNSKPLASEEEPTELGDPVVLLGNIHPDLLQVLGQFRRKIYKKTNTTDNLPIVDEYDKKDGVVIVFPARNKLDFAAVATMQPEGIGFDSEELMFSEDGAFKEQLDKKIIDQSSKAKDFFEKNGFLNYGEIRRLAIDNLTREGIKTFMTTIANKFFEYAKDKNMQIVLFLSEEDRAKFFNRTNGLAEFHPLEGFKLNREDPALQTMEICAKDYFFKWQGLLTQEEIGLFDEARRMITNGHTWEEVIEGKPKEKEYRDVIEKILKGAEDNVAIRYTDYPIS